MASLVVLAKATYSVSTEKVTMVACFLEDQEIELPVTLKTKPLVDLQLSRSRAQLESNHPTKSNFPSSYFPNTRL